MMKKGVKLPVLVVVLLAVVFIITRMVGVKTAQQISKKAILKEEAEEELVLSQMKSDLMALEEACNSYRQKNDAWPDGQSSLRRNKDYLKPEFLELVKGDYFYYGTNKASEVIYHIHAFPKDSTKRYAGYNGFMLYYFDTGADGDWDTKKYGCSKSGRWVWSRDNWPFKLKND